ncbi:Cytohesin-4 [Smittium mucronatum]|uniref:Cytohesin-4 n=1 Tax=Smittium mucronatum TaxID=133383 RepID=A0A1R0GR42_9FUNG|nr:Cytohesin-4 [Smittium mucronatum]
MNRSESSKIYHLGSEEEYSKHDFVDVSYKGHVPIVPNSPQIFKSNQINSAPPTNRTFKSSEIESFSISQTYISQGKYPVDDRSAYTSSNVSKSVNRSRTQVPEISVSSPSTSIKNFHLQGIQKDVPVDSTRRSLSFDEKNFNANSFKIPGKYALGDSRYSREPLQNVFFKPQKHNVPRGVSENHDYSDQFPPRFPDKRLTRYNNPKNRINVNKNGVFSPSQKGRIEKPKSALENSRVFSAKNNPPSPLPSDSDTVEQKYKHRHKHNSTTNFNLSSPVIINSPPKNPFHKTSIVRNESLALIEDSLDYFKPNKNSGSIFEKSEPDSANHIGESADEETDDMPSNYLGNNLVLSPLDTLVAELTSELFLLMANQSSEGAKEDDSIRMDDGTKFNDSFSAFNSVAPNDFDSYKNNRLKSISINALNKDLPSIPSLDSGSSSPTLHRRIFDYIWIDDILTKARRVPNIDEHSDEPILSAIPIYIGDSEFGKSLFRKHSHDGNFEHPGVFYNPSSSITSVKKASDHDIEAECPKQHFFHPTIHSAQYPSTDNSYPYHSNEVSFSNRFSDNVSESGMSIYKNTRKNNEIRRSRTWNENSENHHTFGDENYLLSNDSNDHNSRYSIYGEYSDFLAYSNPSSTHLTAEYRSNKKEFNSRRWSNSGIYRARDPARPPRNQLYRPENDYSSTVNLQSEILSEPPSAYAISPARVGLLKALSRRKSIRLAPNIGKIIFAETGLNFRNSFNPTYPIVRSDLNKDDLSIAYKLKDVDNLKFLSNMPKTDQIGYDEFISEAIRQVQNFRLKPIKVFTSFKPRDRLELIDLANRKNGILLDDGSSVIILTPENNYHTSEKNYNTLLHPKGDFYHSSYLNRFSVSSKSRASIISTNSGSIYLSAYTNPANQTDTGSMALYPEEGYQIIELPPPVPLRVHHKSINPSPSMVLLASESSKGKVINNLDSNPPSRTDRSINVSDRSTSMQDSLNVSEISNRANAIKAVIGNRSLNPKIQNSFPISPDYNASSFRLRNPNLPTSPDPQLSKTFYRDNNPKTLNSNQIYDLDYESTIRHNNMKPPSSERKSQGISNYLLGSEAHISHDSDVNDGNTEFKRHQNSEKSHLKIRVNEKEQENHVSYDIGAPTENTDPKHLAHKTLGLISDEYLSPSYYQSSFEYEIPSTPFEGNYNLSSSKRGSASSEYFTKNSYNFVNKEGVLGSDTITPLKSHISPYSRKLFLHGPAYKIMSALNAQTDTYLFLFSDLLIVTRSTPITIPKDDSNANTDSTIDFKPSSSIKDIPKFHYFNTLMVIPLSSDVTSLELTRNISFVKDPNNNDSERKLAHLYSTLRKIRKKFNVNPYEAVISLVDSKIISPASDKLADFLIRCTELNRRQLGKFLGLGILARELEKTASIDEKKKESMYYRNVWQMYIDKYFISGIPVDEALRHILVGIRLPNDPMAISSLLEIFSNHWFNKNRVVADSYQSLYKGNSSNLIELQRNGSNKIDDYLDKIYKSKNTRSNIVRRELNGSTDFNLSIGRNGKKSSRKSIEELYGTNENNGYGFIWVPANPGLTVRLVFAIMTLNAESHNPLICDEITPEISLRDFVSKFILAIPTDSKPPLHAIPFSADSINKNSVFWQLPSSFVSVLVSLDPHYKKESFLRKKDSNNYSYFIEIPIPELLSIWERVKAAKLEQASDMRRIDPTFDCDWVDPKSLLGNDFRAGHQQRSQKSAFILNQDAYKSVFSSENLGVILGSPGIPDNQLRINYNYMSDVYSDPGFKDGLLFNSSTDRLPAKMNISSPILFRVTVTIPKPDPNYYIVIRVIGTSSSPQVPGVELKKLNEKPKNSDSYTKIEGTNLKISQNGGIVKEQSRSPLSDFKNLQISDTPLDIIVNDNLNPNSPLSIAPSPVLRFDSSNTAKFFIIPQAVGHATIQFLAYGLHSRYYNPLPPRSLIVEGNFMLHTLQLTWLKPSESTASLQSPTRSDQIISLKTEGKSKNSESNLQNSITKARYMFGATSEINKEMWTSALRSALQKKHESHENDNPIPDDNTTSEKSETRTSGLTSSGQKSNNLSEISSASAKADYIFKKIIKNQRLARQAADNQKPANQNGFNSSITGQDLIETVLSIN